MIFFSILNIGVPPFLPFFSEVSILIGLLTSNFFYLRFLFVVSFFAGVYGIYMYVFLMHGNVLMRLLRFSINVREFLVFFGHFVPLLFLVVLVFFVY